MDEIKNDVVTEETNGAIEEQKVELPAQVDSGKPSVKETIIGVGGILGLVGLLVQLVMLAVKGVKKLIGWIKGKKKTDEPKKVEELKESNVDPDSIESYEDLDEEISK